MNKGTIFIGKNAAKPYWEKRAKHHADKLLPLIDVFADIIKAVRVEPLKAKIRLYTKTTSYNLSGWWVKGEGYVGVSISEHGSKTKHCFRYVGVSEK